MNQLEKISHKSNNFGFLRLLLAYLVILSHSPELIDGNASRELLNRLTGSVTFGVFAVNGFFLISGYLICQSFDQSKTLFSYFLKRILRIYPAFVVIWILSVFVITPLAGQAHLLADINFLQWLRTLFKVFILSQPHVEGFMFTPEIQTLNGSMWTIRYEFLCYLSIPLIALIGLNKRNVILLIILFLCTNVYLRYFDVNYSISMPFPISLQALTKLGLAFLVGMCFYQFRQSLVWNPKIAISCFLTILVFMTMRPYAELALILFGSYLLFYFAFHFKNERLQSIGTKNDISYGVYLYAWPVQAMFIKHDPSINPWLLTLYTIIIVSALGFLSWKLVEKPFLDMKNKIKLN